MLEKQAQNSISSTLAFFIVFFILFFSFRKPIVVFWINLSNINNTDGKAAITIVILIIAPLEINVHSEPIISSFE